MVIVLVVFGAWYFLVAPKPFTGTPDAITLGMPPLLDASGLAIIADDQHYFADNGLNVTLKTFETGSASVDGVLENKADIAIATEFIIVRHGFKQDKISDIGTITKSEKQYFLIGRSDHGILTAADLKGKKIAVPKGTVGEFYLGRFLELHGIDLGEVTIIDIPPQQTIDVIQNGTVDAVVIWKPFADTIKGQLGANGVIWSAESGQLGYWNAICENDWISQNPAIIDRFLKSMDQAARYIINHPAEAKAIVQERLTDESYVDSTWPDTQFSLSLDQSLITAMEDEGRWMINNNLTAYRSIPDYREYLYPDALEKLKPEAVNIIG
jgi:ABC-type nitrate/sulfonate/bicarbonate transport system substrate-binding protein